MAVPTFDKLMNPLLDAMRVLGGSASVSEIEEKVAEILKLSEEEIGEIHRGSTTKLNYRLAWARNYLKRYGVIENSSRGVWALTQKGKETLGVDKDEIKRFVRNSEKSEITELESVESDKAPKFWQEELLHQLLQLSPGEFERLSQRILRESGFTQVEVTGRSGDGGIDGRGIIRIGGLLSFHIIFQCKRYRERVFRHNKSAISAER